MKRNNFYYFVAVFMLSLLFVSCESSSEPEVTYIEEQTSSDVHYPNFGASTKYYTLYDANKKCRKGSISCFEVTKTNRIINSADRCDKCKKSWYAHYDKE